MIMWYHIVTLYTLSFLVGMLCMGIGGNGNMTHRTYQYHAVQLHQQISSDYEQG